MRSRGRCAGSGAAYRLAARERTHVRRVRRRRCSCRLVLGGGGLEFLELHLQLVEQFAATLGRGAEPIALHSGDHQLEMRDHRLGPRGARLELATGAALGKQRRLQRVDVVRDDVSGGAHAEHRITRRRCRAREFFEKRQLLLDHPARSGRQVRCGCLQSIPSSM